jgi:hypothetical protein
MTFIEPWDQKEKGNRFFRSAAAPGMETVNFKWLENEITVAKHIAPVAEIAIEAPRIVAL